MQAKPAIIVFYNNRKSVQTPPSLLINTHLSFLLKNCSQKLLSNTVTLLPLQCLEASLGRKFLEQLCTSQFFSFVRRASARGVRLVIKHSSLILGHPFSGDSVRPLLWLLYICRKFLIDSGKHLCFLNNSSTNSSPVFVPAAPGSFLADLYLL